MDQRQEERDKRQEERMAALDGKLDTCFNQVSERIETLEAELEHVKTENNTLLAKVQKLEEKVDDLEGRSRRNNLIFHGIPQPKGLETWAECERTLKEVIRAELEVEEEVEIERAHRLRGGDTTPRPVIACFKSFKDKENVLAARGVLKQKDSHVFVNEDFSPMIRAKRQKLHPFMKKAKEAGKKAFLKFDSLSIEGKVFVYEEETKDLVARRAGERRGQR